MIINSFDDILQAMERDPALREAMRRHILTEELLQLPAQVKLAGKQRSPTPGEPERLETSVAQLQEGQNRLEASQEELKGRMDNLEAGQEELKGRMDSMAGRLGDAVGHAYEARAVGLTPRRLRQVMGIGNAILIMAATQPSS